MWNQLTVDPELGLVYGVTGNPIPYSGVMRGEGKELFTDVDHRARHGHRASSGGTTR